MIPIRTYLSVHPETLPSAIGFSLSWLVCTVTAFFTVAHHAIVLALRLGIMWTILVVLVIYFVLVFMFMFSDYLARLRSRRNPQVIQARRNDEQVKYEKAEHEFVRATARLLDAEGMNTLRSTFEAYAMLDEARKRAHKH